VTLRELRGRKKAGEKAVEKKQRKMTSKNKIIDDCYCRSVAYYLMSFHSALDAESRPSKDWIPAFRQRRTSRWNDIHQLTCDKALVCSSIWGKENSCQQNKLSGIIGGKAQGLISGKDFIRKQDY